MNSPTPDVNPSGPPASPPPSSPSGPGSTPPREPNFSTRRVLLVLLPMVAIVATAGSMVYQRAKQVKATSLSPGMISAVRMRLTKGLDRTGQVRPDLLQGSVGLRPLHR